MKLNLFLAFGLVVSIALAALHDDQKLAAIEEQQRAAQLLEAQREEAFQKRRLATNDTHTADLARSEDPGSAPLGDDLSK